ncbi:tetratricopeptide repeat protein [Flavisolibacter sp. BT320]|nr:tetratricopeptide repeat protein [Flavisolibacter longurius]
MRKLLLTLVFCFSLGLIAAQREVIDSIKALITSGMSNSTTVRQLQQVGETFLSSSEPGSIDSAKHYGLKALELAKNIDDKQGEVYSLLLLAKCSRRFADPVKTISYYQQALLLSEQINDTLGIIMALKGYALLFYYKGDYRQELSYYFKVEGLARKIDAKVEQIRVLGNIAKTLMNLNQYDSAEMFLKQAMVLDKSSEHAYPNSGLGRVRLFRKDYANALNYFQKAINLYEKLNDKLSLSENLYLMGLAYEEQQKKDSALFYYEKSFKVGRQGEDSLYVKLQLSDVIAQLHEKMNNLPEALQYYKIAIAAKDQEKNKENLTRLLEIENQEKERIREVASAKLEFRNKIIFLAALGLILTAAIIAYFLWQKNRQKQKANEQLSAKNEFISKTLKELQTTQAQLIQREKMASLGELTAGIAHEIQNPLNFVNNFSETNTELLEELQEELQNGNVQEVKAITTIIKANEEKITHHGKRADSIVRSMLQHSRTENREREPTDINYLVDEHFRLAYHGYRAKDKSFFATTDLHFDDTVGRAIVIPQELGRVLLNLFNNAFYAINKKKLQLNGTFEPMVFVKTKRNNDQIFITVMDNGIGIPANALDKVFQPFFTSKPAGEGTGLGLSLSYEIITKGHGGELKVKSEEGEFTEFIIVLRT